VTVIVLIFASVTAAAAIVYYAINNMETPTPGPTFAVTAPPSGNSGGGHTPLPGETASPAPSVTPRPGNDPFNLFTPPDRTTVLVMGMHAVGDNTDVNFLLTLDAVRGIIDVVSIPRDLRITLPSSDVTELRNLGRSFVPSSGMMRLGDLMSYAGRTHGPRFAVKHMGNMLGIEIDHFVVLSLAGFRNIVDLVDGIMFHVPQRLLYEDPYQNLFIDLEEGYQRLCGEKAEMLVRYRHSYPMADLDRINVQHDFMREFFVQALNAQAIRANILGYLTTVHSMVTSTDVTATNLMRYVGTIERLNNNAIIFHTLPTVESTDWFLNYEPTAGRAMLDSIFS
jgi:LCP family protein required for cell wall assembly